MDFNKVNLVYFSATDVSRKYAKSMAKALGKDVSEYDITMPKSREEKAPSFNSDELVIVAMPIYSGRVIPAGVDFIKGIKGDNTPCIVVGTYGNRHYDDALVELEDLMSENGFVVVACAALVGRHSFSDEIAGDRPNAQDLKEAADFAKAVELKESVALGIREIPGNRPYKAGGGKNDFYSTANDDCVDCKLCAKNCPVGVISLENVNELAKPATECIMCHRCVVNCPENARAFRFTAYDEMVQRCIAGFSAPARENIFIL